MIISYNCKQCNNWQEVKETDIEITDGNNINKEADHTIEDYNCRKCGYVNTIKIYMEVE